MLETQQINRAIAEALTAQGFDEGLVGKTQYRCNAGHIMDRRSKHQECLYMHRISFDVRAACLLPTVEVFVPHDFANPTYLFPALEAWLAVPNTSREWRVVRDDLGFWRAGARVEGVDPAGTMDRRRMMAERNAFSAALGVNI